MDCKDFKNLMMGYLDNELSKEEKTIVEEHLRNCSVCSKELEGFKELKEVTKEMELVDPEDKIWEQYWSGIYNRIERGIGWILLSIGGIILLIYGGYKAVENLIADPTVGIILKIAILFSIGGIATLLISVLRERLYFWKKDRYRHVRR